MHNTCTTRQVLLVLLCPMLCPLCLVAYACARFGSQWKLYLRYRLSHSNPSLSPAYLRKDARDALRTQLFEPAVSRKDDVPQCQWRRGVRAPPPPQMRPIPPQSMYSSEEYL